MELVAVKTPELALKQIWMFVIAHNMVRYLINKARSASTELTLSFKGTLDTLNHLQPRNKLSLQRYLGFTFEPYIGTDCSRSSPESARQSRTKMR